MKSMNSTKYGTFAATAVIAIMSYAHQTALTNGNGPPKCSDVFITPQEARTIAAIASYEEKIYPTSTLSIHTDRDYKNEYIFVQIHYGRSKPGMGHPSPGIMINKDGRIPWGEGKTYTFDELLKHFAEEQKGKKTVPPDLGETQMCPPTGKSP